MPRKVSRCHQDLVQIIEKTAEIIDIHDIEYIIQYGCDDVDSFFSSLYVVNIKGSRHGQKIKKNILIKWHIDQKQRACFRQLYQRDYMFHKKIAPKLLEIQKTFKVIEGLKIKFPNCIHASIDADQEVIIFANLQMGFRVHSRYMKMSLDHATMAMKNLAKLHALSFVWQIVYPEEFEEVKRHLTIDAQYSELDKIPNSMKYYYDTSVNAVLDPVYKEKLKDLSPHLLTVLKSIASPPQFSTICHGDCWSNNIAFKHQMKLRWHECVENFSVQLLAYKCTHTEGTRPVEVMLVDYQLSRFTSPVADISYFLYMSSEQELLFEHYDALIRVYYGTLAGVLRQCNLKAEEVYPIKIFKQQLKIYSVLGLIEALVSMKIITADCEYATKMAEMKHKNPDHCLYDYELKNQNMFIERVNMVVDSFFRCNYSLTEIMNKSVK